MSSKEPQCTKKCRTCYWFEYENIHKSDKGDCVLRMKKFPGFSFINCEQRNRKD